MCARQLQRFCNTLFVNLFVSFIVLVVISQQTHCAELNNANVTEPTNACNPNRCGPNGECIIQKQVAVCQCNAGFYGDPYTGCTRACETNKDCFKESACIRHECVDPCLGSCGVGANCNVENQNAVCWCPIGYTGDPFTECKPDHSPPVNATEPTNLCSPNRCGLNAACIQKEVAICRCNAGFSGDPYNGCTRACETNKDCYEGSACIRHKCVDPCPGVCGLGAVCNVVSHNPVCWCLPEYTGDPFSECKHVHSSTQKPPIENATRSCVLNSECYKHEVCLKQRCVDPCSDIPDVCGLHASCYVRKNNVYCSCPSEYTGDPFSKCLPGSPLPNTTEPTNLCHPNRCGPNADCIIQKEVAVCQCTNGFSGDPYTGCTRACETHKDCYEGSACFRHKCFDPCAGSCGIDAVCIVINHSPICTCRPGYTGDPFSICRHAYYSTQTPPTEHACQPSPCGPYSACRTHGGQAVCSCLPSYKGSPPNCTGSCVSNSECDKQEVCLKQRCVNPCSDIPDFCALNASCYVRDHNVHCSCPRDHTGDPFSQCSPGSPGLPLIPTANFTSKCLPSPCGPNSQCREINDTAVCSCIPGYAGAPPSCLPPCTINADCGKDFACINLRCRDPCPGTCGTNADCRVLNHSPICSCPDGQMGNPFEKCFPIITATSPTANSTSVCSHPNPCGYNSQCREINDIAVCSCIPGFVGIPPSCRPQCIVNSDCYRDFACINQRCRDPCPGACGTNAICRVVEHSPTCSCPDGHTGNPFLTCSPINTTPIPTTKSPSGACLSSPCGLNTVCKDTNGTAVCTCLQGFMGSPLLGCRPECISNSDCVNHLACINQRCKDPCPYACGEFAICSVPDHIPQCSCPPQHTGDPYSKCSRI